MPRVSSRWNLLTATMSHKHCIVMTGSAQELHNHLSIHCTGFESTKKTRLKVNCGTGIKILANDM